MITRPLDLAARLRPLPRGWDAIFYVNVGALAFFFFLFGSRFVLAPGLAVDFRLPQVGEKALTGWTTDVVISVDTVPESDGDRKNVTQILVPGAVLTYPELAIWLRAEATRLPTGIDALGTGRALPQRRLLVRASGRLPASELAKIYALAADAGFSGVLMATLEAPEVAGGAGSR
ncbi:MAG: hypothetical protein EAZ36_02915 [Verrucomicrobia bacterium]|nr:MAG: hypothetical protein EAZ36_02915 [Verrucomicrobiota bacterium]